MATVGERAAVLREVWRSGDVRRAQLAWGGFHAAEWASLVAVSVVAYGAGGTTAVGLVLFARMAASGVVTPFAAVLGDRLRRERILLGVHALRALAFGGAAAALAAGSTPGALALAVAAAIPLAAHRPCHLGLVPLLAQTPAQLTAANAAAMVLESGAALAGPVVAAVVLAVADAAVVLALCAGASAVSALLVAGVRPGWSPPQPPARRRVVAELGDGVRAVAASPHLRLVFGLFGAQTLVRGFLGVLVVVIALDLTALGEPGVGLLSAAFGLGGLAGAVGALAFVGRGGLARPFQLSLALWGLPLAAVGLVPAAAVAFAALAVAGLANTVLDVAGFTSIQERAGEGVIGRVFGLFELVVVATVGLGSLLAPVAVDLLGARGALAAVGFLLPGLAVLFHRRLRRLDEGTVATAADIDLLRANPVFAALPFVTLRGLAASLERATVAAGETIVREGDRGDAMYLVRTGRARVTAGGAPLRELGPGDAFGEIALVLDVPRTATVTATTPMELVAIAREPFIGTATRHQVSGDAARALVEARIGPWLRRDEGS